MKKIIAFILTLLMLLPMIFSCSKDDGTKDGGTTGAQGTGESLPVIVENLDGKVFNVLSTNSATEYAYNNLTEEDMSGGVLQQAVFSRNVAVFERLNASMTVDNGPTGQTKLMETVRTTYSSGDLVYDFIYGWAPAMTPVSLEGCCATVDKVSDVIDFSDEWWEDSANKSTSINGVSYGIVGDANLHFYESIYVMAYNVDRANELGIPNLSQLALDGGWTLEEMNKYAKLGYTDDGLNGSDSIKNEYDRFGFTTNQIFVSTALLAAGETIIDFDKNTNYPTFNGFSDRMISIYEFIRDSFYTSNYSFMAQNDSALLSNGLTFHDLFVTGNTLLYAEPMGSFSKLKNSDFEYSVLPIPKWNADDEYRSALGQYVKMFYIPSQTSDFRTVAIFLDNLNYQSMIDVTPTYMEEVVSLQRLKNQVSYEVMQNIILKADKVVSLVLMFNWSDINTNIQKYACENRGLAALGASLKRSLPSEIEKTLGPKK